MILLASHSGREVDLLEQGMLETHSRDKSEIDDNSMCVAETPNIILPQSVLVNVVKQMDLVTESTKHLNTEFIEVIQT